MEPNDFICKECNLFLEKPITLPCGCNVCKLHLDDEAVMQNQKINCSFCDKIHPLPDETSFRVNRLIEKLLSFNYHLSWKHKMLKQMCDFVAQKLSLFEQLDLNEPVNYLDKYFGELRKQIRFHHEQLVENVKKNRFMKDTPEANFKILSYTNRKKKLESQLQQIQKACVSNISNVCVDAILNDVRELTEKVNEWYQQIRNPNLQSQQINDMNGIMKLEKEKFDEKLVKLEKAMLMNQSIYFVPTYDDEELVGKIEVGGRINDFEDSVYINKFDMLLARKIQKMAIVETKDNFIDTDKYGTCDDEQQARGDEEKEDDANVVAKADVVDVSPFVTYMEMKPNSKLNTCQRRNYTKSLTINVTGISNQHQSNNRMMMASANRQLQPA